jgi:Tfp pilus assembly protein PilO
MVLSFGVLYAFAKKFAKPTEWPLAKKLFLGILIALLVFYIFVVAWNTILFAHFL